MFSRTASFVENVSPCFHTGHFKVSVLCCLVISSATAPVTLFLILSIILALILAEGGLAVAVDFLGFTFILN